MKKTVVKIFSVIVLMTVCIGCGGENHSYRMIMTVEGSGEIHFELKGSGTVTIDWGDGSDRTICCLDMWCGRFSKTYAHPGRHTITITGNDIVGLEVGRLIETGGIGTGTPRRMAPDRGGELLTGLDVRRNTKLMTLAVRGTQLTSLDLSNNTALTNLDLKYNQLTSLDLSNNTALTDLDLSNNQLTNLDLSNNTALGLGRGISGEPVNVRNNQLTASALNALFESLPLREEGDRRSIRFGLNSGSGDANTSIAETRGWHAWR